MAGIRIEGLLPIRFRRVGLGVGVRVEDPGQLPSLLLDLVEHLEMILGVKPVGAPAAVRIGHGIETLHSPIPPGQEPTRFIGQRRHRVFDHLVSDIGRDLDHLRSLASDLRRSTPPGRGDFLPLELNLAPPPCGASRRLELSVRPQRPTRPRISRWPGPPSSTVPISAARTPRLESFSRRAPARSPVTAITRPPEVWASARTSCSASGRSLQTVFGDTKA